MTNDNTTKTVNVEFSHTVRDDNDVDINLEEYRDWLGLAEDEDFEFIESELISFLNAGPEADINISARFLDDFRIEQVNFDRDC